MTLLEALKKLQEKVNEGLKYKQFVGICGNIQEFEIEGYWVIELKDLWKTWEGFSGNRSYPVIHPYYTAEEGFYNGQDLWVGEYGKRRKALLSFLISELEKQQCLQHGEPLA